jgi:hypothetical protein
MIIKLAGEACDWFPLSITRHNDPTICYYKLRLLTDFGMRKHDLKLSDIIKKAARHKENNLFAVRVCIPEETTGFPKADPHADEWHALPCDSPLITYILLKLGYNSKEVLQTVDTLRDKWNSPQGWFCNFAFVKNFYKKLQVPCQMAGLYALEVFSLVPELKESAAARNAFAPIAFHKDYGKSMYYFGRSKKFWTFKYPFIWYNAFYLAEVLTRFNFLKTGSVVKELITWIQKSQDADGRFTPTSMFRPYREWEFADKKRASGWITFLCCRILKRYYG